MSYYLLSNSGLVSGREDFSAFGEEIASGTGLRTATQGFGSTLSPRQKYGLTERDDATGLDHTPWRKHENRAGRWTSPDPYNGSMSLGNPQTFNRYSYVQNRPTNFVDSSGLNEDVIHVYTWTWGWWDNQWSNHWGADNGGDFGWLYDPVYGPSIEPGGMGVSDVPKIDDKKLKDCIRDQFKVETAAYEIGKSFSGVKTDYGIFMWLLDTLSGSDHSSAKTITQGASTPELSFVKNGLFGMPGIVSGWTPASDSGNNFITNDYGGAPFRESMWVYELGNSLGYQTGNLPSVQSPERYENMSKADPHDIGGALVDCVYGGKVTIDGKIVRPKISDR